MLESVSLTLNLVRHPLALPVGVGRNQLVDIESCPWAFASCFREVGVCSWWRWPCCVECSWPHSRQPSICHHETVLLGAPFPPRSCLNARFTLFPVALSERKLYHVLSTAQHAQLALVDAWVQLRHMRIKYIGLQLSGPLLHIHKDILIFYFSRLT